MGYGLDHVEALLLTHAHSEHTGFAEQARTDGETPVHCHEAERERAVDGQAPPNERGIAGYLRRPAAWRTLFALLRRGGTSVDPIVICRGIAVGVAVRGDILGKVSRRGVVVARVVPT